MDDIIKGFQYIELTQKELSAVMGGTTGNQVNVSSPHRMSGGINVGLVGMFSCDVCGPGIGVFAVGSRGVGPFVSAFNTTTINTGTDNSHTNNPFTMFN